MALIRLTKDQRLTLRKELRDIYQNPDGVQELLDRLDRSFADISVQGSNFRQNLFAVIKAAEVEGWLLDLVKEMRQDVPVDSVLERLERDLVPLGPLPDVDYFEVCRLTGRRVMVDRAELRATLRLLSAPLGSRIMVVTGCKSSGKSHSVQLMSYLTEVRGGFSLIPIDLEAYARMLGADAIIQPSDIARALVRKLGYAFSPADPPADAQWARWVLDFCEDFEAHALQDAGIRWVVIDGFGSVVLTQATLDLVKELAVRIDRSLTRFRLVLLGYDDSFPPGVLPQVERESIGSIGERELTEFFIRAYRQLQIPCDEEDLVDSVSRVLEDLDLGREDFLFQLEPRVFDELARAAGPGDGR